MRLAICTALALGLAGPGWAADLAVERGWIRAPALPGGNGAAFFVVVNDGAADRLIAAESPIARRVELHTHRAEDGVMRMRPVAAVEVPARGRAELRPKGDHVMLIGVDRLLAPGERIPLTLVFENAGRLSVDFPVVAPGGAPP